MFPTPSLETRIKWRMLADPSLTPDAARALLAAEDAAISEACAAAFNDPRVKVDKLGRVKVTLAQIEGREPCPLHDALAENLAAILKQRGIDA